MSWKYVPGVTIGSLDNPFPSDNRDSVYLASRVSRGGYKTGFWQAFWLCFKIGWDVFRLQTVYCQFATGEAPSDTFELGTILLQPIS
jgi:hypothetical protein